MTEEQIAALLAEILPVPSTEICKDRFAASSTAPCTGKCDGSCGVRFV
jgi:hypothetical protein